MVSCFPSSSAREGSIGVDVRDLVWALGASQGLIESDVSGADQLMWDASDASRRVLGRAEAKLFPPFKA